jgi:hypothetical protein
MPFLQALLPDQQIRYPARSHQGAVMGDIIDLSSLYDGDDVPYIRTNIDVSGKPKPKDVRVLLNSGIEVKCEVRYDGLDPDGTRRYCVIAEIDWENYFPTTLVIGEHPTDTTLVFRIPGIPDDKAQEFGNHLVVLSEHIVETR